MRGFLAIQVWVFKNITYTKFRKAPALSFHYHRYYQDIAST